MSALMTIGCHGPNSWVQEPRLQLRFDPVIAPNCIAMVRKLAQIAFFIGLVAVIALSLLPLRTPEQ